MRMKSWLFATLFASFSVRAAAQAPAWQPAPGRAQVAIWPWEPPDARSGMKPESSKTGGSIAGRPVTEADDVSRPTMTVYAPAGKNTGAAIVVFPGGGYQILAMDLEGTEVCDWLTTKGVTCILLKYRVPHSGPYWDPELKRRVIPPAPLALEDAQRTLRLVRAQSARWQIDPHKVGVLGFSAGGHLAAAMSTRFHDRLYKFVDAADDESCRPDFAAALYPGHLWVDEKPGLTLNPEIRPTKETPPQFILQAEDDNVDNVNQALVYYTALKDAKVPVEMHLYAQGGHAFGLRRTKLPITQWPDLVEKWLKTIGMIER